MNRHPAADDLLAWLYVQQGVDAVQHAMTAHLEATTGCSLLEHSALYRLKAAGGRMRMTELAELLAVSPSGATRIVAELVRRGWVDREQPADNRRQVHAVLTDTGRDVLLGRTRPAYVTALHQAFSSHLTDRDLADLRRIGRKLLEAHDRWDARRFATEETEEAAEPED